MSVKWLKLKNVIQRPNFYFVTLRRALGRIAELIAEF